LAHSIGVFNTARQLATVVNGRLGSKFDTREAQVAVAAALVHDIGHGPFSHAFEDALKKIGIARKHELRTRDLLDLPEMRDAFDEFPEFPDAIADLIESEFPKNIYASIVSSQFDADRLDYMRRDRMMSGTLQSAIDFEWLLANLDVARVPVDQDGKIVRKTETLVIREKAIIAAEGYIFSLLYLYINVYYHKTTRGLEKLFTAMVSRIAQLVSEGAHDKLALSEGHPLVRFLEKPDDVENFLRLDDAVVLGSLSVLAESKDKAVSELAGRIRDRSIYRCVDVSQRMFDIFGLPKDSDQSGDASALAAEVAKRVAKVGEMVAEEGLLDVNADGLPLVLEDTAPRSPYKRSAEASRRLSRIHVIAADGRLHDLADMSPAVNSLGDYKAYRLYGRSDSELGKIEQIIKEAAQ
jgi:HD superfamily phosphohydrolase